MALYSSDIVPMNMERLAMNQHKMNNYVNVWKVIILLKSSLVFHHFLVCDTEEYFDWEMIVEQKFNSHLVPKVHRFRQSTSVFKDFAII